MSDHPLAGLPADRFARCLILDGDPYAEFAGQLLLQEVTSAIRVRMIPGGEGQRSSPNRRRRWNGQWPSRRRRRTRYATIRAFMTTTPTFIQLSCLISS